LIFDEIYCGMGRTGRWFACEHFDTTPDLLVVGKALTGMLPFSAVIGTREVMDAWPPARGEAIHTSTFLGNPIACAAALAQIDQIETHGLVLRSEKLGAWLGKQLQKLRQYTSVVDVRGLGLMQGVQLADTRATHAVTRAALVDGILVLAEGTSGDVIA